MLWNACSIKNKLFYFQFLIYAKSPSIIAITETWLLPQILNNEIIPAGYQNFHRDRINGIGGGILLAISNSFMPSHSYICSQTSEFLQVQIERNPPPPFFVVLLILPLKAFHLCIVFQHLHHNLAPYSFLLVKFLMY